jgi:hypothetical protein
MNLLPQPLSNQLHLLAVERGSLSALTSLIVPLALNGTLQVLDGNNRFNLHLCGRAVAQALYASPVGDRLSLGQVLERIQVARAFTCYQVVSLLAQTPTQPYPTLVLDLLASFYDENVPGPEARRLLATCLRELRRLCALAPVVVSIAPMPAKAPEPRQVFVEIVKAAADQVWILEDSQPPRRDRQPRLPNF